MSVLQAEADRVIRLFSRSLFLLSLGAHIVIVSTRASPSDDETPPGRMAGARA
jgi:hypothetical protein